MSRKITTSDSSLSAGDLDNADINNTGQNQAPMPDDISRAALNMGIASFFFGVIIFSLMTLKLTKLYKQTHNGRHCRQSKAALICGILSLILWIGIIGFAVYSYLAYTS